VHGLNPAHGLGLSGVTAYGAGLTGLLAWLGPPREAGRARDAHNTGATARRHFGAAGAVGAEVQARQGLGLEQHD
jgi:hypothetical protein